MLRAGRIPERELGKITVQLLDGLAYIHKEFHVLHRDIKPANVLVKSSGEVKLSDFGVIGQVSSTLDQVNSHVGTSAYMRYVFVSLNVSLPLLSHKVQFHGSPERMKGEPHRMSSDCWSLGMIVLECALGYYPLADPKVCASSEGGG